MHPPVKLFCQVLNASCLIINIRLYIILHQLRHDINIIIKHLDIHIITVLCFQIRSDIIHPVFQGIYVAHQYLQPQPAFPVCCNPYQLIEFTAQVFDQVIGVLQPVLITDRLESDGADHQLIQALIHFLFKIQIIIVRHRHVAHDRIISIAVAVHSIDQINHHD